MNLTATKGVSYTYVVEPESSTHACVSYTGQLPPGLSITFSAGNATISGTPTTAGGGSYEFSIHETNTSGAAGTIEVTLVVTDPSSMEPPVITCEGAVTTTSGGTMTVTAGDVRLLFSSTNFPGDNTGSWNYTLPTGLSLSGYTNYASLPIGGTLSAGSYLVPVTVYNHSYSDGPIQTDNYILSLTVNPATPVISVAAAATLSRYVGQALTAQCSVQTLAGSVVWTASNLPAGCTINASTGLISGTPTTAGTYQTMVTATNSSSAATLDVDFLILAANGVPVITCTGATPTSTGGSITKTAGAIGLQFTATNGGASWSGSLPTGLSLNSTYGFATGTLTPGNYQVAVSCNNLTYTGGTTQTAQYILDLTVAPAVPVVSISSAEGLIGTTGTALSVQFSVQAAAGDVTWAATGLPNGCSINAATGAVSGIPTLTGNFSAVITATNSAGSGTYTAIFSISASSTSTTPTFDFLTNDPTLTGIFIEKNTGAVTLSRSDFKRGQTARFCLVFLSSGQTATPPSAAGVEMGLRVNGKFASDALWSSPTFELVAASGSDPAYLLGSLTLDGDNLEKEFAQVTDSTTDTAAVTLMSDIRWSTTDGFGCISKTFTFTVSPAVTA